MEDRAGRPVEGATVGLVLTGAGGAAQDVGGLLMTDTGGKVAPHLYSAGSYLVTVTAPGFLPHRKDSSCQQSDGNFILHNTSSMKQIKQWEQR